jgi:small subunit ribosomal protein S1
MSTTFTFATTTRAVAVAPIRSSRARVGASSVVATRAIVSDTVKGEHAEQYAELASLLENYQYSYKVGDKVHGKVVACDQKGALVEIGAKADALVPTSECSLSAVKNVRAMCDAMGVIFCV